MTEREQFDRQENWKKIHAALEGYVALASHMNDEVCQSYCEEWQRALEAVKIAEEEENRIANLEQAARATPALPKGVEEVACSPTKGMNLGERINHVGGRENEAGYIEFGSVMAVDALINHILRDLLSGMAIVPVVNIKSIVRDFEHHGRETPIRVEPFVRVNFAHEDWDARDTFHAMLASAKEKNDE